MQKKHLRNFFQKSVPAFISALLIFQNLYVLIPAKAQETDPTPVASPTAEVTAEPVVETTAEPTVITVVPTEEIIPTVEPTTTEPTVEVTEAPVPTVLVTPTTETEVIPTVLSVWKYNEVSKDAVTNANVEENVKYTAPQNANLSITFTSLPAEKSGKLIVEEVILSDEKVKELNAVTNVAYDIRVTNLVDGEFTYNMTYPSYGNSSAEIKYSEDGGTYFNVTENATNSNYVEVNNLNHFTLFAITFAPPPPSPMDGPVLIAPTSLGYNVQNNPADSYALPHPDVEISCGGITNINAISHHWTDVTGGDTFIKYQRQYQTPGSAIWSGNEIYTNPYTNFRVFSTASGVEGTYNSRVRAFYDSNNNNQVDVIELVSDWSNVSNECQVTYDKMKPVATIIDSYARILSGIACGEGRALKDDGLQIAVTNWSKNPTNQLWGRYYAGAGSDQAQPFPNLVNLTGNLSDNDLVSDIATFTYNHTGSATSGYAGWEVFVINSDFTAYPGSGTDTLEYQITNDLTSPVCTQDAPATTISYTGNTPTNDNTVSITGSSVSPFNNIKSVEYRYSTDGGSTWSAWIPTNPSDGTFNSLSENFTFDTAVLPDGNYIFEARATNTVNIIEPATYSNDISVTIDTVKPSMLLHLPVKNSTYNNMTPIVVSATSGDNIRVWSMTFVYKPNPTGDYRVCQNNIDYSIFETVINTNNQVNFTHSTTLSGISDGKYCIGVFATDTAGNVSNMDFAYNVTLDTQAPPVPTGLKYITQTGRDLGCGSFSNEKVKTDWDDMVDSLSGIKHYEYKSFNPPTGWVWPSGADGTVVTNSEYMDWGFDPDEATYGFMVRSVDNAGNKSAWTSIDESFANSCKVTIDMTTPVSTITIQGDLDETKNISGDGGWHGNGWYESYDEVTINIDTVSDFYRYQLLAGNVACPAVGTANGYSTLQASGTNLNTLINGSPDGEYTLCYYAEDLAGNTENPVKVQTLKKDDTNPTFSIDSVTGTLNSGVYYQNTDSVTVGITADDVDSGYTRARFDLYNADASHACTNYVSWNQDNLVPAELSTSRNLTVSGLAEGNYCLRIWVYDDVQNKSWTPTNGDGWVKFTIDTVAPVVDITQPASNGLTIFGTYNIQGTVVDENLLRYWFVVENSSGTVINPPSLGTVYDDANPININAPWDTTQVPNGTYTIKLEARDKSLNKDNTSIEWVTVEVKNVGTIQGRKYIDINGDGLVTNTGGVNETTYVNGWKMDLYKKNVTGGWDAVSSNTTGAPNELGQYKFENLAFGEYLVCEDIQNNDYMQTGPKAGTNPTNVNGSAMPSYTGKDVSTPLPVAVANSTASNSETCWNVLINQPNEVSGYLQFGNFKTGTISGYKFSDKDNDGSFESIDGEVRLAGWTINISGRNGTPNPDNTSYITEDNSNNRIGYYEFTGLEKGDYQVCEENQSGWQQTTSPTCYDLTINTSGQILSDKDFGNVELGSIQGRKFSDDNLSGRREAGEAYLNGWNISLYDGQMNLLDSMLTGSNHLANGQYRFENLVPDTYTVCEEDRLSSKWVQTKPVLDMIYFGLNGVGVENSIPGNAPVCYQVMVKAGKDKTGVSFGNYQDLVKPLIDTISDQTIYEGEEFDLGILNGKGMSDNVQLKDAYLNVKFEDPTNPTPYILVDTNFDISGVNGDGKGGTLNDLFEYYMGYPVDFSDVVLRMDTSIIPEGQYTFNYYVEDLVGNRSDCDLEAEGDQNCEFTITVVNVPPVTTLNSNQTINEGDNALFTGSFTDPSYVETPVIAFPTATADTTGKTQNLLTYADDAPWTAFVDYGLGNGFEALTAEDPINMPGAVTVPGKVYPNSGIYTVTLKVCEGTEIRPIMNEINLIGTDNNATAKVSESIVGYLNVLSETSPWRGEGECSTASVTITVNNLAPTVNINPNPGTTVFAGTAVTLTANGAGGNAPLGYVWGGACSGTGLTYTLPSTVGTYNCNVTVTDADGDTAIAYMTVTVSPRPVLNTRGDEEILGTVTTVVPTGTITVTPTPEGEVLGITCDTNEIQKVSGYVYIDSNKNGKKDDNEKGIENVSVIINVKLDGKTEKVVETDTDSDGYWEAKLCPGSYSVEINKKDLPKNTKVEGDSTKNIKVEKEEKADVNFQLIETKGFNWWICIIPLAILIGLLLLLLLKQTQDKRKK